MTQVTENQQQNYPEIYSCLMVASDLRELNDEIYAIGDEARSAPEYIVSLASKMMLTEKDKTHLAALRALRDLAALAMLGVDTVLRVAFKEPEDASSWVGVDEQLPEQYRHVLIRTVNGTYAVMYCYQGYWAADDISGGEGFTAAADEITHWMPLPEPPSNHRQLDGGAV